MLISVITISYNNALGLDKTIQSVVNQTYSKIEYIVIDGGSKDNSVDIIQRHKDKIAYWVSESDKGIYNAMNKGVSHAHGEYCIFLNSGDTFYETTSLTKVIECNPRTDIVSSDVVNNGDYKTGFSPAPDEVSTAFMLQSSLPHPATLIKTNLLQKFPYREEYKIVSDWAFFFDMLILKDCSYQHIPIPLSSFYLDGISNTQKDKDLIERHDYLCTVFSKRIVKDIETKYTKTLLSSYLAPKWTKEITRFIIRICLWVKRHVL